ncbi:hypothetical protein ABBQ38_001635 [Trebouxia sp. C0009 RCD-2024]
MLGLRAAAQLFQNAKSSPARSQLLTTSSAHYLQMASKSTQGAKLRTPKGFNKLLAVNMGFGVDQHGQDATEAAVRAVKHAMESTALPGVLSMVPGGHDKVKIKCKIGVPDSATVDVEAVKKAFYYGHVDVKCVPGGLRTHSGIIYPQSGDPESKDDVEADTSGDETDPVDSGHKARDEMFAAVASIRVGY